MVNPKDRQLTEGKLLHYGLKSVRSFVALLMGLFAAACDSDGPAQCTVPVVITWTPGFEGQEAELKNFRDKTLRQYIIHDQRFDFIVQEVIWGGYEKDETLVYISYAGRCNFEHWQFIETAMIKYESDRLKEIRSIYVPFDFPMLVQAAMGWAVKKMEPTPVYSDGPCSVRIQFYWNKNFKKQEEALAQFKNAQLKWLGLFYRRPLTHVSWSSTHDPTEMLLVYEGNCDRKERTTEEVVLGRHIFEIKGLVDVKIVDD